MSLLDRLTAEDTHKRKEYDLYDWMGKNDMQKENEALKKANLEMLSLLEECHEEINDIANCSPQLYYLRHRLRNLVQTRTLV